MSSNKSLIFGIHAVEMLLNNQSERVIQLCVQQERHDKKIESLMKLAKDKHIPIEQMSRQAIEKLTQSMQHQGIVARVMANKALNENDLTALLQALEVPPFLLILDGVQDPHNLGACFRSAEAAGVHAIIAPKDKSVGITPVVSKVACGAAEIVPFIQVTNLARTLKDLRESGLWIYGAAEDAPQSLYKTKMVGPIALVLGAEGSGLRRLTREHCDVLINIPMHGAVSSLNVSVAAGVFMFEIVRQRTELRDQT